MVTSLVCVHFRTSCGNMLCGVLLHYSCIIPSALNAVYSIHCHCPPRCLTRPDSPTASDHPDFIFISQQFSWLGLIGVLGHVPQWFRDGILQSVHFNVVVVVVVVVLVEQRISKQDYLQTMYSDNWCLSLRACLCVDHCGTNHKYCFFSVCTCPGFWDKLIF